MIAALFAVVASQSDASAPHAFKSASPARVAPPPVAEAPPASPVPGPPDYRDEVTDTARQARGAYYSGPYVHRLGVESIVNNLEASGMNAAVIDMKDGQGRVTYDSSIDVLADQEHIYMADPGAVVRELKSHGVYTIARVVCFADPLLGAARADLAIIDDRPGRRGRPWVSWGTGGTWLDPYNQRNHDMILALVREVATFGFDEIQLDYIRFPVDDGTDFAIYPAQTDQPRAELLLGLLRRIDAEIRIPLGVDVFGLTAFDFGDAGPSDEVLGQELERWLPHVEVFTPMLYLNSMTAWGRQMDNRAYTLIRIGSAQLRQRLGPSPVIRPFIQAFEQGSDTFDPAFIADQVRGARRGDADGFLFWHPRSNYSMVIRGMRGPGRHLSPFPLRERPSEDSSGE